RRLRSACNWRVERVADAVGSADERRSWIGVLEHSADFLHQSDQGGVRHDPLRPETLMQFRFRHDARRGVDQQRQQVERFGREMRIAIAAPQLPPLRIELESAEAGHDARFSRCFTPDFPGNSPDMILTPAHHRPSLTTNLAKPASYIRNPR